jgi:hypothetical protein
MTCEIHRVLIAAVMIASVTPAGTAAAQSGKGTAGPSAPSAGTYAPPRTPWGDPDLQGIWPSTDMVGVPFERPAELSGLVEVSDKEFAERAEQARKRAVADGEEFVSTAPRTGDGTGPPSHWLEWGKPSRQASLVVTPADGRLPPMTPEGQSRAASLKNTYVMFSGFNDYNDFGPYDRCITRGVLGSTFPVIYNNGNQIFQMPGYVVIRYEMIHETRVIPLDGRPHGSSKIRSYMGDARGHWDGTTLVVETTNFNGKNAGDLAGYGSPDRGATPNLRIVERFTPVGPNAIEWSVTLDDAATWPRPWTFGMNLTKDDTQPVFEYACHEGNYGLTGILSAARAEER